METATPCITLTTASRISSLAVGLAWNVKKDMVVRAAYTLSSYLEGTGTNLRLTINPPFAHETDANYTSQSVPSST